MRIPKSLKVATLIGIGAVSFLVAQPVANRLMAGGPRRAAAAQAATTTTTVEVPAGAPLIPAGAGPSIPTVSSYSMSKPTVVHDGDALIIHASASIRDVRPNLGYVWAVHVFAGDDQDHQVPLFEHWFDDQMIQVKPEDESVEPTLSERLPLPVPLPAGSYRVTVGAYRVPPELGLEVLKKKRAVTLPRGTWGFGMGTFMTVR